MCRFDSCLGHHILLFPNKLCWRHAGVMRHTGRNYQETTTLDADLEFTQMSDEDLLELLLMGRLQVIEIDKSRLTEAFLIEACRQSSFIFRQLPFDLCTQAVQAVEVKNLIENLRSEIREIMCREVGQNPSYEETIPYYLSSRPSGINHIHPNFLLDEHIKVAILSDPGQFKKQRPKEFDEHVDSITASEIVRQNIAHVGLVPIDMVSDDAIRKGISDRPLRLPYFGEGKPFQRLVKLVKSGYWPEEGIWIIKRPKGIEHAAELRLAATGTNSDITLLDAYLCSHPLKELKDRIKGHDYSDDLLVKLATHYPKDDVLKVLSDNLPVIGKIFSTDLGL